MNKIVEEYPEEDQDDILCKIKNKKVYQIFPKKNCKNCSETGECSNIVDYGSTTAHVLSLCDCILDQLPEEFDDNVDEVEIVWED